MSSATEYWKLCLPQTAQCIWYQLNSKKRKRGNCIITRSSVVVSMETSVGGVLCCTPSLSSPLFCCPPSLFCYLQHPRNFHSFTFTQILSPLFWILQDLHRAHSQFEPPLHEMYYLELSIPKKARNWKKVSFGWDYFRLFSLWIKTVDMRILFFRFLHYSFFLIFYDSASYLNP